MNTLDFGISENMNSHFTIIDSYFDVQIQNGLVCMINTFTDYKLQYSFYSLREPVAQKDFVEYTVSRFLQVMLYPSTI